MSGLTGVAKILCTLLPMLAGCTDESRHAGLTVVCVAREVVSGMCMSRELRCPEPLAVAQKLDGALFCKIKNGDGMTKQFQDPLPKKDGAK